MISVIFKHVYLIKGVHIYIILLIFFLINIKYEIYNKIMIEFDKIHNI